MRIKLIAYLLLYLVVGYSFLYGISLLFGAYHLKVFLGLIGLDLIATSLVYPDRVRAYIKAIIDN
jgi:hypothetical protein